MKNRKKSREFLMKLLFSDSLNAHAEDENPLNDLKELTEDKDLDEEYVISMWNLIKENRENIDENIRKFLEGWSFDRISSTNRAILRIATAEILYCDDIPDKVSVNEAINLSKEFSEKDSGGFINSVLDKVIKTKTIA